MPECIFPKGREAGIDCVRVQLIERPGKPPIQFCGHAGCNYHEPLF